MLRRSHAVILSGLLLLAALAFEIASASTYPKPLPLVLDPMNKDSANVIRFHQLALILALASVVVAVSLPVLSDNVGF